MIYPDYHYFKNLHSETQRMMQELLNEKQGLFEMTQPKGIDTEKEAVSGGKQNNLFDSYMIALEQSKIDERIAALQEILEAREKLLSGKLKELRESLFLEDKVYRMRYIDRMRVFKIARKLNYSEPQIYRILRRIQKTLKDDKK